MGDGQGREPYDPIVDADILPNVQVNSILEQLPPVHRRSIIRHMMASEKRAARIAVAKAAANAK